MRNCLGTLGLSLALAALSSADKAEAGGIPIVVIYGEEEQITHVGELPGHLREQARRELGQDVSIGFIWRRFHIYYVSFWTWGGEHVLYKGDRYWAPKADAWEKLLGKEEAAKLSVPFFYRFPLGLAAVGGLFALGIVGPRLFPSDRERARRLLKDPRYVDALAEFAQAIAPPEGSSRRALSREAAMEAAVRRLQDQGIPAARAEANFRTLVRVLSG
jgi:hypothetical protein